ncbi:MAG: ABC transporter permease [Caldilinea sp. CFX5]|nr:ABC transporter permease [Caldilinea sp. CFX5]
MFKLMVIVATIVLVLHGLIHLMGTASYLKLVEVQGLPYKTTVLGGRWDLGGNGISLFGALWLVPALGFVVAAVGLSLGAPWWQPLLLTVTLFSLVLTALDWNIAFAGVVVNLIILALLWLGPRLAGSSALWAR